MVSIHLYDIAGRNVGIVYEGPQREGSRQYDLNATVDLLGSGVYFARAKVRFPASEQTRSVRFVVVH